MEVDGVIRGCCRRKQEVSTIFSVSVEIEYATRDETAEPVKRGVVRRLGRWRISQIYPVMGGDDTTIAPPRDIFHQPPGEMS